MKTTKQFRNNRISILFSLIAIILLPFMSKAQLYVNTAGAVSVGSTTTIASGLRVNVGDINLNSATNSYQINGNKVLWNNNVTSNIFAGVSAGTAISSGTNNSFMGYGAGTANTSGTGNSFMGYSAGASNTSSPYNSAFGNNALFSNTTGTGYSCAFGGSALYNNTGTGNDAFGNSALVSNTTGIYNTAIGHSSGTTNQTGTYNTFLGANTAVSTYSLTNTTAIGYNATPNASNKVRIGNSSVTVIEGSPAAYTSSSDGRFKNNIKEEVKGLEFIKKLRPVTYNFDTKKFDEFLIKNMPDSIKAMHTKGVDYAPSTNIIHTGFIAQEVEKAAKDCSFNFDGVHAPVDDNDNYSLAYSQFVVPLIKAVQELSKTTDNIPTIKTQQDSTINAQNVKIADLQNQILNCCSNIIGKSFINNNVNPATTGNNSDASVINGTSITTPILYQNVPNPFNQSTSIQYAIPATTSTASIMIFDLTGKLIKTIPITTFGNGSITINGNELSPGMFVYSLIVDGKIIDTKRMILTQ